MKIIYQGLTGISIISPSGELPIGEVARKDVPEGAPYLIVDDSVVPTDWTSHATWVMDFSAPAGYGIGADAWFAEQATQNELNPLA